MSSLVVNTLCPLANGTTISRENEQFVVYRSFSFTAGDCYASTSFDDCIDSCAVTNSCVAVAFDVLGKAGCCQISTDIQNVDIQTTVNWIAARNIRKQFSQPASSVSALSVPTPLSTTTSSKATSTTVQTSSSDSAGPSTTSTSNPAETTQAASGLSTGAKAGVGVGVAIIILALLAGCAFFAYRRGKQSRRYGAVRSKSAHPELETKRGL
ncbi:hypothetical protein Slin15195_G062850 [Septoria linicola]|uniref:Apple domain-containing protein n=1 Tax=Septoria linicola TaxID=215465 RepID=A0A9Q9EIN3_9PEZI|nr:hypothetical protein Slin15195_G062850 [Septoria linicola]